MNSCHETYSLSDFRWKNESAIIVDGNRNIPDRKYFLFEVCSGFIAVEAFLSEESR